jgi:hypothetical protein
MDLRDAGAVLWRFRFVVVVGLLVALLGGLLAYVRVGFDDSFRPTFSYREDQVWSSDAVLFVTQKGFPWGRSVIIPPGESSSTDTEGGAQPSNQQFADAARFGTLAMLYATLATSDPVRQIMLADGPLGGEVKAAPILATETLDASLRSQLRFESPLPLIRVTARADSPAAARTLASREVEAFLAYLDDQQNASRIPPRNRVEVSVLQRPAEPKLVEGRSKLYAAIVFVGLALGALTLPFVLNNALPRTRRTSERPGFDAEGSANRLP